MDTSGHNSNKQMNKRVKTLLTDLFYLPKCTLEAFIDS